MQRHPNTQATHCPPEMIGAGCAPTQTSPEGYQTQHHHFASQAEAAQAVVELDQRIGACIVRASNAGYSLHVTQGLDGRSRFVVSRWGWARDFTSLQAVESWLDRVVGVPS